jgi:hypothetical protein
MTDPRVLVLEAWKRLIAEVDEIRPGASVAEAEALIRSGHPRLSPALEAYRQAWRVLDEAVERELDMWARR